MPGKGRSGGSAGMSSSVAGRVDCKPQGLLTVNLGRRKTFRGGGEVSGRSGRDSRSRPLVSNSQAVTILQKYSLGFLIRP